MSPSRKIAVAALVFGISGCGAADRVQSFDLRREADGARAYCGGTTGAWLAKDDHIDPAFARCVTACKRLGFVVESSFPPGLHMKTDVAGEIPESECLINRNATLPG